MKAFAVLIVLLMTCTAQAQGWRDTLSMARNAYKAKDYSKALEYYRDAQKSAPENVNLSDEMGQSAYKAEDYAEAEKIYQQNQGNKTSKTAKADNLHNLGNTRMKSKNYEGAVEAYKDALRMNPNDEKTRYNLSEAMRKLKKEQQQQQQQQQGGNGNNQNNPGNNNPQQNQQGNQGNQQQNANNNSQGQDQASQGQQQGQGNQQKNNNQNTPQNGSKGQLSNKTADRILDDLLKKEAETKRRMADQGGSGGRAKSGKDW